MNKHINARNLMCPLPVIRAQDAIAEMSAGQQLEVTCTDPGALNDIPAWCRIHGHEIIHTHQDECELRFIIKVA